MLQPSPHILMWGELQHAHLGSIFSLIKQPLVSLKMSLSSATNGLPDEIKRSFKYSTLLTLQGFE